MLFRSLLSAPQRGEGTGTWSDDTHEFEMLIS